MWWVGGWWWVVCKPILVFSLSLGQAEQLMNEKPNIFFMPIPYQTQGLNSLTLQKPTHRILTSYYVLNPLTSFWSVVGGWWVLKGILMFCVWSNLKLCSRPRPKLHNWFMYSIQSKYKIILQRTSFPKLMQLAFWVLFKDSFLYRNFRLEPVNYLTAHKQKYPSRQNF